MNIELNTDTNGYDRQNALIFAKLSDLAYQDKEEIFGELKQSGFYKHHFIDNPETGTQGFIAANDQHLVIVFRGTQLQLKDLTTDAEIKLVVGDAGKVHRGFFKAFNSIRGELELKIQEFQDNQQRIWLSGHSLGAAIATLAAMRLALQEISIEGFYNYGSPRVGDGDFVSALQTQLTGRSFRVRNNNDVVTRVPVAGIFLLRYRHIDSLVYFDSQGKRREGMGMMAMLIDHFRGHLDDIGELGSDGLKDHKIASYLKVLERDMNATG